jgi:hypothetical protein
MARLSHLDDVLFAVGEHPIFVSVKSPSGEKRISVPDKKAIVHGVTGRVLGIVSRGYRLVSNRQALEWTFQCCGTVFPETKSSEWTVKAIDDESAEQRRCKHPAFHFREPPLSRHSPDEPRTDLDGSEVLDCREARLRRERTGLLWSASSSRPSGGSARHRQEQGRIG